MKKLILFTIFSSLFIISCRKNYTCVCEYSNGDTKTDIIENQKRSVASIKCHGWSHKDRTCKLK